MNPNPQDLDGFIEGFLKDYTKTKANNKPSKKLYIPFLTGRPERTKTINQDDINNLLIELNTNNSVDSFINS